MSRVFRLLYYGDRQRKIALGLALGSSATIGGFAWHAQKPLYADSVSDADIKSRSSKSTVTVTNSSRSSVSGKEPERFKNQASRLPKDPDSQQPPPPQTKGHSTFGDEGDIPETLSAWQSATQIVGDVCDSLTGWDFLGLKSKINVIVPSWIRMLPAYVDKLQDELSGAPWSLSWEIWEDAHDPEVNPEIIWDARVRISKDLCPEERAFLAHRRKYTTKALATYLDVAESDVHPDDVPTIALCRSGGGLRALVAGAASGVCADQAGLLDCVTYTAGVSGSCWLQTLYNSSVGQQDHARIIDHLKQRLGVHIAYPPAALGLLSRAPTNKFLLSGLVEKLRGVPDADFGIVDLYGLLLAGRLMVPKHELNVSSSDLKVSNQRYYVQDGAAPLPIYTAVRHEIPKEMEGHLRPSQAAWHNTKHYDWFQWFEWTPYEFFCEELECGIPTWAMGRRWNNGNTVWRENGLALPELRAPLLMGIWGSAFCATLSHYYKEIRPILKAAGLDKLDTALKGADDDLVKLHPIDPAVIPNYAWGLGNRLPDTVPASIREMSHLQLMDAGMSNNLPIYPLLRPGRDVDIVLAFDASADVKGDNWPKVVDGYVRQRGINGWPMGAGWPPDSNEQQKTIQELDEAQLANAAKLNQAFHESTRLRGEEDDLGHCNVWVGSKEPKREYMDETPARRLQSEEDDQHLLASNAGICFIYFPFLANEKVEGVDPLKSDFMSTWNFIYTPEEMDKVVALAKANFEEGREQTKRTIRAVWQRKKALRLQKEKEDTDFQRSLMQRRGGEAVEAWEHFSGN